MCEREKKRDDFEIVIICEFPILFIVQTLYFFFFFNQIFLPLQRCACTPPTTAILSSMILSIVFPLIGSSTPALKEKNKKKKNYSRNRVIQLYTSVYNVVCYRHGRLRCLFDYYIGITLAVKCRGSRADLQLFSAIVNIVYSTESMKTNGV